MKTFHILGLIVAAIIVIGGLSLFFAGSRDLRWRWRSAPGVPSDWSFPQFHERLVPAFAIITRKKFSKLVGEIADIA